MNVVLFDTLHRPIEKTDCPIIESNDKLYTCCTH